MISHRGRRSSRRLPADETRSIWTWCYFASSCHNGPLIRFVYEITGEGLSTPLRVDVSLTP